MSTTSAILTGTCPKCNGTGHMPCPDERTRQYGISNGWYGYRVDDDTVTCYNCGGQYQNGTPRGKVRINNEGVPCTHSYSSKNVGRCLTEYTCSHCNDTYRIDSGD